VEPPEVRYVLVVRPKIKYSLAFFQKADFVLSRFASSPASLAWEKIPFSFVIDWFVDVRGALNGLDNLLGTSPWEVVSFTRSFSYGLRTQATCKTFSPCDSSVLMDFLTATAEYKSYERSLASGGPMPIWSPRFGKSQAAISAALITQALLKLPGAMRF
jgi:hypothetical protein